MSPTVVLIRVTFARSVAYALLPAICHNLHRVWGAPQISTLKLQGYMSC